jgi:hypothetical protein
MSFKKAAILTGFEPLCTDEVKVFRFESHQKLTVKQKKPLSAVLKAVF